MCWVFHRIVAQFLFAAVPVAEAQAGLLEQVRLGDGVSRFEIQDVAHHHAVCTRCGATEDVSIRAVHALAAGLRRETGFVLGQHPLLLPGLCGTCAVSRE